jgi:hypothetical protein
MALVDQQQETMAGENQVVKACDAYGFHGAWLAPLPHRFLSHLK